MLLLLPILVGIPLWYTLVAAPCLPPVLRPDAFLWPVMFLGLFSGPRANGVAAFSIGLVRDVFGSAPLFSHAMLYVIIWRLLHRHRASLYRESRLTLVTLAVTAALIAQLLMAAALILGGSAIGPLHALGYAVQVALPTGLLAPTAFAILARQAHRVGVPTNRDGEFLF